MVEGGMKLLEEEELVKRDDVVVFVFGASPVRGATDMIKIHKF
jgi:pyruvate kinase